jgi:hypothetical protein
MEVNATLGRTGTGGYVVDRGVAIALAREHA